jgi:hypothetical protein
MNWTAYRETMRQLAGQMLQLTPRVADEALRRQFEALAEKIIEGTEIAGEHTFGVTDSLRHRF